MKRHGILVVARGQMVGGRKHVNVESYFGACKCGWATEPHGTPTEARAAIQRHVDVIEKRRARRLGAA